MSKDGWIYKGMLSSNRAESKKSVTHLYEKCFPAVQRLVTMSGTAEQARDIFQEGLIVLYNNLLEDKFQGNSAITTYLISICKNLWLNELKKAKSFESDSSLVNLIDEEELIVNVAVVELLQSKLDPDCQAVLKAYYYDERSMEEISSQFGLSGAQSAKTKKLRCMKKLITMVKEKGLMFNYFLK
ncbi:MAG: sigma-70 family RNA polymerase sigma factor [Bacteroidota bacterium]